ncbi:hypothetical protein CP8484711_0296, partial [Chlamydia psittaci 84-8471/1]
TKIVCTIFVTLQNFFISEHYYVVLKSVYLPWLL